MKQENEPFFQIHLRLKPSMACDTVKLKSRRINYFVKRGNDECYRIEWKREGEERGNVEIAGFAVEGALRGRGYRKRYSAQGNEYLMLPGLPHVHA
jgi:hypothetical protein